MLKIPGIGVISAKRIISSRKYFKISFKELKKMGIVLKRAKYFITCDGEYFIDKTFIKPKFIERNLVVEEQSIPTQKIEQLGIYS